MNSHIPNPKYIDSELSRNVPLVELDKIIHPGLDGELFRAYSKKFIDKLAKYKITTFDDLVEENELIEKKSSKLPLAVRKIVQGHLRYYMSEIDRYTGIYNELSDEQKEKVGDHKYFVIKDESSGIEIPDTEVLRAKQGESSEVSEGA